MWMVWSRRLSSTMGDSKDFVKALTAAFKDTSVIEMFHSMFQPVIEDVSKDLQNKLNLWHKKFVEDIRSEMDVLRNKLKEKNDNIVKLENEIESLKNEQDCFEQYTRRNSLRISGVPESDHEDVGEKVLSLCNGKLRNPVKAIDIDHVHRVGRPGTGTRASVFKAKAVLRPGGRHPRSPWTLGDAAGVTSESAEAEVPPHGESATATDDNTTTSVDGDDDDADNTDMDYSKIYISEDLTRQRHFIFWKTTQAKKTRKIKDCWTTDGQIIIRNNANKIISINSLNDLINNTYTRYEWFIYMCANLRLWHTHEHVCAHMYAWNIIFNAKPNLDLIVSPLLWQIFQDFNVLFTVYVIIAIIVKPGRNRPQLGGSSGWSSMVLLKYCQTHQIAKICYESQGRCRIAKPLFSNCFHSLSM